MSLSSEQLEAYRRDGYLILERVFSPAEVEKMRLEADRILELIINSSLANGRTSRRLDLTGDLRSQSVRKIQPVNDLSLILSEVSADERLVGPLRDVMGDEPVLMEEKLNYKQPLPEPIPDLDAQRPDTRFPLHSDWAYYKAQNYPQTVLSSALCIDDCTPDSGPVRIWPGSHARDLAHRLTDIGLEVEPGLIDTSAGVDVLAPAGSVLIFSSLLIHNSQANTSARPRRLMIYSHYPQQAALGFDVRNGPSRLRESPWEWEYIHKKADGTFTDRFKAPVLTS